MRYRGWLAPPIACAGPGIAACRGTAGSWRRRARGQGAARSPRRWRRTSRWRPTSAPPPQEPPPGALQAVLVPVRLESQRFRRALRQSQRPEPPFISVQRCREGVRGRPPKDMAQDAELAIADVEVRPHDEFPPVRDATVQELRAAFGHPVFLGLHRFAPLSVAPKWNATATPVTVNAAPDSRGA